MLTNLVFHFENYSKFKVSCLYHNVCKSLKLYEWIKPSKTIKYWLIQKCLQVVFHAYFIVLYYILNEYSSDKPNRIKRHAYLDTVMLL